MIRTRVAIAIPLCLLLVAVGSLRADVKSDTRGLVKFEGALGRMVSIFGGKAARDGVRSTVAVKGDRKATLNDADGQIVDLNEEKIYDLDIRRKTYRVTTFDELRRRMQEAQRKAEEAARTEPPDDRPAATPDPDRKEIEVDFDVKETGQTKTINGFNTRQVIMTIALREKDRTIEESGGLVVTTDLWLAPTIAAMKEIAEFDLRYAQKLQGPMMAGASAEQIGAALAMYPMLADGLERLRAESVKLDGTAILTTATIDAVKSAEQLADERQQDAAGSKPTVSGGVGGLLGGLARRAVKRDEPQPRATFMTTTNEVLKVTADVAAADVAIPAGFKETK